jgi:hypothetical protein
MEYKDGVFYLFFSAFYRDRWRERSHVVGISTTDWIHFSKPFLHLDGKNEGWTGMCSPNVSYINDQYVLTFNSWGDRHPNKKSNQLFYCTSNNLQNWSSPIQFLPNLTAGRRVIDIALAFANGKYYGIWKENRPISEGKRQIPLIATSERLDDEWEYIEDGKIRLHVKEGADNRKAHENYQFLLVDGKWYLLSLDYSPHSPFLYTMAGDGTRDDDWLIWEQGFELLVPLEMFNTNNRSNAPFIADWRHHDGYFYMLYAGRTEGISHARRGNNKLGLARSKDLHLWAVPPNLNP